MKTVGFTLNDVFKLYGIHENMFGDYDEESDNLVKGYVKRKYRSLMKEMHPDNNGGVADERFEMAKLIHDSVMESDDAYILLFGECKPKYYVLHFSEIFDHKKDILTDTECKKHRAGEVYSSGLASVAIGIQAEVNGKDCTKYMVYCPANERNIYEAAIEVVVSNRVYGMNKKEVRITLMDKSVVINMGYHVSNAVVTMKFANAKVLVSVRLVSAAKAAVEMDYC